MLKALLFAAATVIVLVGLLGYIVFLLLRGLFRLLRR